MEAQWSPQWSLNGRHWSSKGGTMVVQGRQTSRSNWNTMFAFLTGRPMADHCASILRPRRCACLHPASFERPVSDRPPRRPLCDCFEHAQNFTATMASMAMPERPVYHPWTTKATVLPPFCLQRRPGQFCGRTREAQRSQPLCKGGITNAFSNYGITRVASWGPDRRKWLFSEVRGGIWTPHSPVLIKISAGKRPLNQLTVKKIFFSLIINTFCH